MWKEATWPNFKTLSQNLPGETEENHENSSQDSLFLGPDLNPGPCEYERIRNTSVNHSTMTFGGVVAK
jgi:hypothetical protein